MKTLNKSKNRLGLKRGTDKSKKRL